MHNLFKTTALVTAFATFEHFLSFLYRIVLSRTLGAEGLGVYQIALAVYTVFLTVSSSGLPVTLSRTISKHRAAGSTRASDAATSAAALIALLFGVVITVLLFLLRAPFSRIFTDSRSADLFYILLLGLTFTALYTVIRGSFWGNRRFFAYSSVELLEEVALVTIGIVLIVAVPSQLPSVNKAAIAVLISHVLSFVAALVYFFVKGGKFTSPRGEFLPLFKSSVPVTSMRTLSSLITSLISVIFPLRMIAAGVSPARAMSEYGIVFGMTVPILSLPSTLIGSIALVLVPELSECYYKKDKKKLTSLAEKALHITLLTSFLLIPLMLVCGENVGVFLFSSADSGKLIALACPMLIPMSLTLISTSMLNSMGCEKKTLLVFLLGSVCMLVCVWTLPRYLGGAALLVGMALDYTVTASCSLWLIHKYASPKSGKFCLKLLLVALPVTALGFALRTLTMRYMSYIPATLIVLAVMSVSEGILLNVLGLFDFKELFRKIFPKKRLRKNKQNPCTFHTNVVE